MKFESEFGIGEIVLWHKTRHRDGEEVMVHDELLEIVGISFSRCADGRSLSPAYHCRFPDGRGVLMHGYELKGDPEFDQELGAYPEGVISREG